jgi:CHAT domain-containing protein/tetratricopeptide (TPR) repeat protein
MFSATGMRNRWQVAAPQAALAQAAEITELRQSLERNISSHQQQQFHIALAAAQYLRLTVRPHGISLRVSLAASDGKALLQTACHDSDPIHLSWQTESADDYRLYVDTCETEQVTGSYQAVVDENRPAGKGDRDRVAALQAVIEGDKLRAARSIVASRNAVDKYQAAQRLWHSLNDGQAEVETLVNIGALLQARGERTVALATFKEALDLNRQIKDEAGQGRVLNDLGNLQALMGDYKESQKTCERALDLSRAYHDTKNEARARSIIGEAYFDSGELRKSVEYQQLALRLAQDSQDRRQQAQILLRLGYAKAGLGDIQEAFAAYHAALPLFHAVEDHHGEAFVFAALGHLHSNTGDKQNALNYYSQANALLQEMEDPNLNAELSAGLGYVYFELGEFKTALRYYQQSQSLYREIRDRWGEAGTYLVLGTVYRSLNEPTLALESFKQGTSLLHSLSNPGWESYLAEQIGAVYEDLKQTQTALTSYKQALLLSRFGKNPRAEGSVLNHLGLLYQSLGEPQLALQSFNQSIVVARSIGDRFAESAALYDLARLQHSLHHDDEARKQIEETVLLIERLRSNVSNQGLRASYFATVRQSYELNVDILMQLDKTTPKYATAAFELSERARARSLLELLKESRADIRGGVDPQLLDRERQLEQELNAKAERHLELLTANDNVETESVNSEITTLTTEYEQVKAQIRANSPRYAALTQPQPLSLAEIRRQLLDDNTVLLEYLLGDDHSYVWAVTRTEVSGHELPSRAEIEKVTHHYYDLITAKQPRPGESVLETTARVQQAEGQLAEETASLSKLLLAPIANKLGVKRLLIVADGALQTVPFQALTIPGQASANDPAATRGQALLIQDHEIIYEPSASTLALVLSESADRKPAGGSVAILADPVFEVADSRIKTANSDSAQAAVRPSSNGEVTRALRDSGVGDKEIPRLFSSREEADAIISVVPWRTGFKAVDFDANRATAMSSELSKFRIVHFATHALLDNEHPELSGIVLSLVNQKGQPQDGFLRMNDIYNLKLPVDLVVLSACQTGLGKDVKGEGLIGLTRGFMYAGASGVVASLWKVDDDATAELMKHFYAAMFEKGLTPAAALRDAQLKMREQKRWRDPYFWAGFVIQGRYAEKITVKRSRTVEYVAASGTVAAILVLSITLALRRRRGRVL